MEKILGFQLNPVSPHMYRDRGKAALKGGEAGKSRQYLYIYLVGSTHLPSQS